MFLYFCILLLSRTYVYSTETVFKYLYGQKDPLVQTEKRPSLGAIVNSNVYKLVEFSLFLKRNYFFLKLLPS